MSDQSSSEIDCIEAIRLLKLLEQEESDAFHEHASECPYCSALHEEVSDLEFVRCLEGYESAGGKLLKSIPFNGVTLAEILLDFNIHDHWMNVSAEDLRRAADVLVRLRGTT